MMIWESNETETSLLFFHRQRVTDSCSADVSGHVGLLRSPVEWFLSALLSGVNALLSFQQHLTEEQKLKGNSRKTLQVSVWLLLFYKQSSGCRLLIPVPALWVRIRPLIRIHHTLFINLPLNIIDLLNIEVDGWEFSWCVVVLWPASAKKQQRWDPVRQRQKPLPPLSPRCWVDTLSFIFESLWAFPTANWSWGGWIIRIIGPFSFSFFFKRKKKNNTSKCRCVFK